MAPIHAQFKQILSLLEIVPVRRDAQSVTVSEGIV